MQKVLICSVHGGFGLSQAALHRLRELEHPMALAETDVGETWEATTEVRSDYLNSFLRDIERNDPLLLQVYDELGDDASAPLCKLTLIEVPDGVSWHVEEYDGLEWVAEDHRTWN